MAKIKLCFNCLGTNHNASKCINKRSCKKCGGRHHTLLHIDRKEHSAEIKAQVHTTVTDDSTISQNVATYPMQKSCNFDVLLPTAKVIITGNDGSIINALGFLEQSSQASFITERYVQMLQLQQNPY